jgi:hypothetical protein
VTTLAEVIEATEHLSVGERQQLVASLLVSLRKTEQRLPPQFERISDLRKRAECGDRKAFEKFLAAVPDVPPMPGDEL